MTPFAYISSFVSNTRIAHQGTIFSLLLLLVALAVAGMVASGVRSISVIDRSLHDFNQKTVAKQAALERLQGALGVGGLVQGYKDYILQPDEDRLTEVTAAAAAAREALEAIATAGVNQAEEKALSDITGVVDLFARQAVSAQRLAAEGKPPEAIDKTLFADVAPAEKGIAVLREAINKTGGDDQEKVFQSLESLSLIVEQALVAVVLVVALMSLVNFWWTRACLVKPINGLTAVMSDLAGGRLETAIPGAGAASEIGKMAGAVAVVRENFIEMKRIEREQEEAKQRADAEKREMTSKTADDFEASIGSIVATLSAESSAMRASAETLSAGAEEANRQSSAAAAAANQASSNVQTAASASESLSHSITDIGRKVSQSAEATAKAGEEAKRADEKVQGLADAARQIGKVTELITDIANQTHMLALNTTIEASRAGDTGRDFAVVASEVKNLAARTSEATAEISAQIAAVQTAANEAVLAIHGIDKSISEVNETATSIVSAVEDVSAVATNISRGVTEAATAATAVSENISGITQATGETGAASARVLESAEKLSRQADNLRGRVERFLEGIRGD